MSKLIECKTCKKEFSDSLAACPHCGEKRKASVGKTLLYLAIFGALFWVATDNTGKQDNQTLKDLCSTNSSTIRKIVKTYMHDNNISSINEKYIYTCAGEMVYSKSEDIKINTVLQWCNKEITSNNRRTHFNTAEIMDNFSRWDGSYGPIEKIIKDNMNDPSSYEHINTTYRLVYVGTKRPHMYITTVFRGKNALGGIIKNSISAKVDAKTKKLYDIEQ